MAAQQDDLLFGDFDLDPGDNGGLLADDNFFGGEVLFGDSQSSGPVEEPRMDNKKEVVRDEMELAKEEERRKFQLASDALERRNGEMLSTERALAQERESCLELEKEEAQALAALEMAEARSKSLQAKSQAAYDEVGAATQVLKIACGEAEDRRLQVQESRALADQYKEEMTMAAAAEQGSAQEATEASERHQAAERDFTVAQQNHQEAQQRVAQAREALIEDAANVAETNNKVEEAEAACERRNFDCQLVEQCVSPRNNALGSAMQ
jgi:chromosome segregation ATPase